MGTFLDFGVLKPGFLVALKVLININSIAPDVYYA